MLRCYQSLNFGYKSRGFERRICVSLYAQMERGDWFFSWKFLSVLEKVDNSPIVSFLLT